METADVVIVGAGVVGCSIAYHLTQRKAGRVIVLDRDQIGTGTTSRGSGGVRLQFGTAVNIQLSLKAVPFYEQFGQRFGVDLEYQQRGYLFLAHDQQLLDAFRQNLALQQELGVPSRELSPAEIKANWPYLTVDDVVGGAYCAKDGRLNPQKVVLTLADQARFGGAEIREWVTVSGLRQSGDRVTGVETNYGEIEAPVVVNAAGPWAAALSAMAGLDEPVTPLRRQQFLTAPTDLVPKPTPFVIDGDRSFSFHSLGNQIRVGMAKPGETSGWNDRPDPELIPLIRQRLQHRAPTLGDLPIVSAYAGLYEMSPDAHGIVGWAPDRQGFLLCNGFSGHGIMHSPIVGQCVAELILDGHYQTVDLTPLRPTRFAEGAPIEELLAIV
jgi:glycine/D-amino acid oxidase-like deaminating enzyme